MLRNLTMVGLLVGGLVTVGVAGAPSGESAGHGGFRAWAHTPLGRLVSGNIGRALVLRSQLNVTDEQRSKIGDVLRSHRQEIVATVQSVRARRTALRDAVLAEETDESAIRAAAEQLGDAMADAAVKASKLRSEVAPLLTDQQKDLIADFLKERDESINAMLEKVSNK